MIADLLVRLSDDRPLGATEARRVLARLLDPKLPEAERPALLLALARRPARPRELARLAAVLRARARPFPIPRTDRPVDLCGSGGARRPSFNVSTVSAFVVAAAGVPVVKHGNRSARGRCGSTDLLVALGLLVDRSPAFARASYRRERLAFLHAPLYHPDLAVVAGARRTLGIATTFHRLGPLSNPARVRAQVVGVATPDDLVPTAGALRLLGVRRGVAMTSEDGCDEFSPHRPTHLLGWGSGGPFRAGMVRPGDFLEAGERTGRWGGLDPEASAEEAERILAGGGGACRGSVLLTSGAALWVTGAVPSLRAGVDRAREVIDEDGPQRKLEALRAIANRTGSRGAR